jgi:hypothetical protein
VYGIRVINGIVFMAAYAGGDHIVYDPSRPWDQINNINPVTLTAVGPGLIRPHGKSVIGPDGAFWTGWMAKYGVYGGGLTRIDTKTYEMKLWYDPIPEQSIEALAVGGKYLYFTTSGRGNGLKTKMGRFYLGVWDPKGELINKIQLPQGEPGCIEVAGNYGVVAIDKEIKVFECNSMDFCSTIKLKDTCTCMVKTSENKVLVFCGAELFILDPANGENRLAGKLPGTVKTATVNGNGEIFFPVISQLYKMIL